MEYLNKVELCGVVGSIRTMPIGDTFITRFAVATDCTYEDKSQGFVVETTWHNCTSFDASAKDLQRGDKVHVLGRIRRNEYVNSVGERAFSIEILTNKVQKVN